MRQFVNKGECPIGNGGGTCKYLKDVERLIRTGVGAIEIGSITVKPREINKGDTAYTGKGFTLNSLGLPNPGKEYYDKHLVEMVSMIQGADKKAIINVAGFSKEEYGVLTELAFDAGADFAVLNLGCPNVVGNNGKQKEIVSYNLAALKSTVIHTLSQNKAAARAGKIGIKLSPLDPGQLERVATFLNSMMPPVMQHNQSLGYVGFVTTQNTVPNCYYKENGRQAISPNNGLGGMAGSAVLPQALGQIRQFRQLLHADIQIVGIGGVTTGEDMRLMIENGASLVQATSVCYFTEDFGKLSHIGGEYLELIEEPATDS